jgi:predicted TIM-barrel fold metal-dependent hydrolase
MNLAHSLSDARRKSMTPLTRREVLAAGVAIAAGVAPAEQRKPQAFIIDTHTHFYDPTRKEGVPWPAKDDKVLYRPVLPVEYEKLATPLGILATIVVEASPWVEDNQWLLDVAAKGPCVLGVVGNLSLADKDFDKNLKRFVKNEMFRGIRVSEKSLSAAIKDNTQLDRLKALSDNGLTLDVNGGDETFLVAAKAATKLPKLRIVVNHMANPTIDGKEPPEDWQQSVTIGARGGENLFCKLSALVEGSRKTDGKAPTDLEFYKPTLDYIWKAFGADRLMFGSNWPVSDIYAKFDTVFELASKYVKAKGDKAFDKVFGANAAKVYGVRFW